MKDKIFAYTILIAACLGVFFLGKWHRTASQVDRLQAKLKAQKEVSSRLTEKLFETHSAKARAQRLVEKLQPYHKRRTKWLARALVSETDSVAEMEYIATVVRNRVETCFRGECTFEGVVTDPWQFSAFNRGRATRSLFINMDASKAKKNGLLKRWVAAMRVANDVILSRREDLPLPQDVLYFYSPISMEGRNKPQWARYNEEHKTKIANHRFRFHKQSRKDVR